MQGNISWNDLMDSIGKSQSSKPCSRKNEAVIVARVQFLEASDHIASHVFEDQMRVVVA